MNGKNLRLNRIFGQDQRTIIVPLDQSVTSGPIPGLVDLKKTINQVISGKPDALIMQRGPVSAGLVSEACCSLIIHLSAATELSPFPQVKTNVCSVEEALRLGADGVSVHISLGMGSEKDNQALAFLGSIASECSNWGMPLIAMMYVYNKQSDELVKHTIHAARVACDLGADILKISYTGDMSSFARLIESSYIPVIVAGGQPKDDGYEILHIAAEAIMVGARGVCIGRNVYQHANPISMLKALRAVVHDCQSAEAAYNEFIFEGAK